MTVTYSLDVSSSSFWVLHKLLFRWKGSVWQCVWSELAVWMVMYAFLSILYRVVLTPDQKIIFEDVCIFFETYSGFIPITFMLGFYVNAVFTRWTKIFDNIGWIDTPALVIAQAIQGSSERARIIRRNCLRYMVLTQAMVFRDISIAVRKRFPSMNHLVTAGLMTENELEHFDSVLSPHKKYWQPMHWLFNNVRIARDEGYIRSDIVYCDVFEKIRIFRGQVLNLTLFDWVPVPLVYTQVVHLAVRSFFAIALLGRQYLHTTRNPSDIGGQKTIDLYIPVMTILQFIFFVGWMKVAEVLLNPLGEDDDDFEVNYILDRNLQVGLSMVDGSYNQYPTLERDHFWEDMIPEPLYTIESAARPSNPQIGSCSNLEGTEDDRYMLRPRRHTSYSSKHNLEIDENDVVQVQGFDKIRKNGSVYNSGDSLAYSQSYAAPTRKLSEMFKRLKGRPSISLSSKRKFSRGDTGTAEEGAVRSTSFDSMDRFDEAFHNGAPAPPTNHSYSSSSPTPHNINFSASSLSNSDMNNQGELSPGFDSSKSMMWTIDEMLPIIEEEEQEKKHHSDESIQSNQSTVTSMKTHKKENGSRKNDESDNNQMNTHSTNHHHHHHHHKHHHNQSQEKSSSLSLDKEEEKVGKSPDQGEKSSEKGKMDASKGKAEKADDYDVDSDDDDETKHQNTDTESVTTQTVVTTSSVSTPSPNSSSHRENRKRFNDSRKPRRRFKSE